MHRLSPVSPCWNARRLTTALAKTGAGSRRRQGVDVAKTDQVTIPSEKGERVEVLPLALLGISNIIVGVWGGMVKIGRCFASAGVRLEFFYRHPGAGQQYH